MDSQNEDEAQNEHEVEKKSFEESQILTSSDKSEYIDENIDLHRPGPSKNKNFMFN